MHRHRQAEACSARHAGAQRLVVGRGKVVHPGRAHEGLEADDPPVGELVEAVDVARHEPAPEREVDVGRAGRGRDLEIERGPVERRWARVQRHVDEGRRAAGGERPGSVVEPLPVRAARIVAVDVSVDDAGEDVEPARRRPSRGRRPRGRARSPRSAPSTTPMSQRSASVRGDHGAAANQEIEPAQPRAPVSGVTSRRALRTGATHRRSYRGLAARERRGIP